MLFVLLVAALCGRSGKPTNQTPNVRDDPAGEYKALADGLNIEEVQKLLEGFGMPMFGG